MTHTIQQSSIEAYTEIMSDGTETTQLKRIYNHILAHPHITRADIASDLGLQKSTVSARVAALRDNYRAVIESGRGYSRSETRQILVKTLEGVKGAL